MNAATSLPRIVRFLDTLDAPDSRCPHCGATGRFILRFVVDGGQTLGAMRGCVKLFPVSPVATEELRLRQKLASYRRRFGVSATLNQRDTAALDAIESFYAGTRDERSAMVLVKSTKTANQARFRR